MREPTALVYPLDPLASVVETDDYRRSLVSGVLESYNGNYDFLAEAVQNAVDALEDAQLCGLRGPFRLVVTINLADNSVSVLDTGVGMTETDLTRALAPHVSLKADGQIVELRGTKHSYRGYKGVGLTLLAYGTDDLRLHSKREGENLAALRMRYANAWARRERHDAAKVDRDTEGSPLKKLRRGTFVRLQFSSSTRPRSLKSLTPHTNAWMAILRTRTAIGQVLIGRDSLADVEVSLTVIDSGEQTVKVEPSFLFPSEVVRNPEFRFLDVGGYYQKHRERADIPVEFRRQDGVYLVWDTERIRAEYTETERQEFSTQLEEYSPHLYAFVPYQGSVWGEVNEILSESKARNYLSPGLVLAINRQRLADPFAIGATRYETFSRNVLIVVHFDNARPDQGRKTVQDEVLDTAKAAANRAVQYLAKQRSFLRPVGETPSPGQRQVELGKQDWEYNVRKHHESHPLHVPPVRYESEPLTEQDVVGLFHQFAALGVFPGIRVLATSQSQTYDSVVFFNCGAQEEGLRINSSPLGLAPSVLGDDEAFSTMRLTLEFKNTLDGLIADMDDENKPKQYQHVDICVCWDTVQEEFAGYELSRVDAGNADRRRYPGTTHLLQRDGETHVIQVVMLSTLRALVEAGELPLT